MSRAGKDWSNHELELLKAMRSEGKFAREIVPYLPGRTFKAVVNMVHRHEIERSERYLEHAQVEPSIPPEAIASEALKNAIITAIMRYANDNGIDVDTAAYRLLSRGQAA